MNAILQALFHIKAFREAVHETAIPAEQEENAVIQGLQGVFAGLESPDGQSAVSTRELLEALDVDEDAQQDITEFSGALRGRLEPAMGGTYVRLFEGTQESVVRGPDGALGSPRTETFHTL